MVSRWHLWPNLVADLRRRWSALVGLFSQKSSSRGPTAAREESLLSVVGTGKLALRSSPASWPDAPVNSALPELEHSQQMCRAVS